METWQSFHLRPGSATTGRKGQPSITTRTTGELGALPADPEAAGTAATTLLGRLWWMWTGFRQLPRKGRVQALGEHRDAQPQRGGQQRDARDAGQDHVTSRTRFALNR